MTDRLDARIRALVVEMLDQPPEPPEFPSQDTTVTAPAVVPPWRRGWVVATAGFLVVAVVGVLTILLSRPAIEPTPVVSSPAEAAEQLSSAVNAGDLDAVLQLFGEDGQCVVPGGANCEDLFGFFIAAEAQMVLGECAADTGLCSGYLYTDIHDALGITLEKLQAFPNFHPLLSVEGGSIVELRFSEPFTGIGAWDDQLWPYLLANDAPYVNSLGIPHFSADIAPDFLDAARQFTDETGGFGD